MKLYHGTSETRARHIMRDGLKPRGEGMSNWEHSIESNPKAVYLTDAYPLHFCVQASEEGERWAVVEVETDHLDAARLRPDEDFLEQVGRGKDNLPKHWDMKQRTRHYRKQAEGAIYASNGAWELSLKHMGTVAFYGTIPVEAITRVAFFDTTKNFAMAWDAMQASIALINYKLCAPRYRALTRWVFGGEVKPEELDNFLAMEPAEPLPPAMAEHMTKRREQLTESIANRGGLEIVEVG